MVSDHILFFFLFTLCSVSMGILSGSAGNDSKPKYSLFSWISCCLQQEWELDLCTLALLKPMQHYSNDVFTGNNHINRAKRTAVYFLPLGIHAWAIYGVVGLGFILFWLLLQITSLLKLLLSVTER